VSCPAGAAHSTLTGKKVASVIEDMKRRVFVFMMSAPKRKGRRQRLLAPPAIYIKKARLSVWLRHHLCEVVDSDLAPAAAAPAATTPAVTSNAFVVTTVALAAAPLDPAAAPPAAGSAANTTEEEAASTRAKASFFIFVSLNYGHYSYYLMSGLWGGKMGNGKRFYRLRRWEAAKSRDDVTSRPFTNMAPNPVAFRPAPFPVSDCCR
jgi:hypothetical protein